MFTSNPFAELTVFLSPLGLQICIILIVLAITFGTLFDTVHKSSAKYLSLKVQKSKAAVAGEAGQ